MRATQPGDRHPYWPEWTLGDDGRYAETQAQRTEDMALRVANRQMTALDELALIDYDLRMADPDVRVTVFAALRMAAERELDR